MELNCKFRLTWGHQRSRIIS